jgi:hypothetical protein
VAYGCTAAAQIEGRQKRWLTVLPDGRTAMPLSTARAPKRAGELVGGSLHWIIKHVIVARQVILGVDTAGARPIILLDPAVVPVLATARRSHQGWRYLEPGDAPPDIGGEDGMAELPPRLAAKLATLRLI